jgi:hypothetical protein
MGGSSGGLPVSIAFGVVDVPPSGGAVALPTEVPSPEPTNYTGYTFSATFPTLAAGTSITVTDFGGDADVALPPANIWGATCPVPLQDVQMVFPAALTISSTPSITIANLNSFTITNFPSPANAPYYYNELFDGSTTPSTVIASEKVNHSSTWPAGTIILPSMNVPWSIVPGHRYVFEIVSSTGQFLTCGESYA